MDRQSLHEFPCGPTGYTPLRFVGIGAYFVFSNRPTLKGYLSFRVESVIQVFVLDFTNLFFCKINELRN